MDYGADEGAARERIKELEAEVARLTDADNESVRVMMAATDEVDRLNLIIAAQEGRIEELEDRLERSEFVAEYLYDALGPANDDIRYDAERAWESSHGAT